MNPSRTKFGQWVRENGLDEAPANSAPVRSDAMWLAEHWQDVESYLVTSDNTENNPRAIRTACRAAGLPCAVDEVRAARAAPAPTALATVGWIDAVRGELGELPPGCGRPSISGPRAPRYAAIVAHFGAPIPRRVEPGSDEARRLAAAVVACANPPAAVAAPTASAIAATSAAIQTEVAALSETARQRFERIVQRKIAQLTADYQRQVSADVATAVVAEKQRLLAAIDATNTERLALIANRQTLEYWMTQDEFRQVLGCLHPDRHPEDAARYGRAFDIVKRLEGHLGTDRHYLRRQGWAR